MRAAPEPSARERLRRVRRLARTALAAYGVRPDALALAGRDENVVFAVRAGGARYVLRIHNRGYHDAASIASELMWLRALGRELRTAVPEPLPGGEGGVLRLPGDAVGSEQLCTLLRWVEGRRHEQQPRPVHLRRLGRLMAALHEHASGWTPPAGFVRPTWDAAGLLGARPHLVRGTADARAVLPPADRAVLTEVAKRFEAATRRLGRTPLAFGLIHNDLHLGNVVFRGGTAQPIDFDDCGWGWYAYDVVAVSHLFAPVANAAANRAAFVAGYREVRPLDDGVLAVLDTLRAGRLAALALWLLNRARSEPELRAVVEPWLAAGRSAVETLLGGAA